MGVLLCLLLVSMFVIVVVLVFFSSYWYTNLYFIDVVWCRTIYHWVAVRASWASLTDLHLDEHFRNVICQAWHQPSHCIHPWWCGQIGWSGWFSAGDWDLGHQRLSRNQLPSLETSAQLQIWFDLWGPKNWGVPQNGWFRMENPSQMDDVRIFGYVSSDVHLDSELVPLECTMQLATRCSKTSLGASFWTWKWVWVKVGGMHVFWTTLFLDLYMFFGPGRIFFCTWGHKKCGGRACVFSGPCGDIFFDMYLCWTQGHFFGEPN